MKGKINLRNQAVPKIQSGHVPCTIQETSGLAMTGGDGRCDYSTAFKCRHSSPTAIFSKTKFQQFVPVGTTINFIDGFTLLFHRSSLSSSLSLKKWFQQYSDL